TLAVGAGAERARGLARPVELRQHADQDGGMHAIVGADIEEIGVAALLGAATGVVEEGRARFEPDVVCRRPADAGGAGRWPAEAHERLAGLRLGRLRGGGRLAYLAEAGRKQKRAGSVLGSARHAEGIVDRGCTIDHADAAATRQVARRAGACIAVTRTAAE